MDEQSSHGPPTKGPNLSCFGCRNKKSRCDRAWPRCGRCLRLGELCVFPASRQSQVGKRKKVRDLEAKVDQLEGQLKSLKSAEAQQSQQCQPGGDAALPERAELARPMPDTNQPPPFGLELDLGVDSNSLEPRPHVGGSDSLANEVIGLGLFEQLPSAQLIRELTDIYFDRLHYATPMLHRSRYTASLYLPPHMRPPMCLQYAVMALATTTDDTHRHLTTPFYLRARAYAEADEMRGRGEHVTLAHAQCWNLVANFEAQHLNFPRSSTSLSLSIRIAQMLNLHRIDNKGQPTRQTIMPAKDWSELEERRRTWWVLFCADRLASGVTGWPVLINERDIFTLLPASEEAFMNNLEERTSSLTSSLRQQDPEYSSLAGRVLASCLFHRTLELTSESFTQEASQDIQASPYWKRQTAIDNDLVTMLMFLPSSLQLPRNVRSLNAVFVNVIAHTAVICLHRAGLGKSRAGHLKLPDYAIRQSQDRLLPAAEEVLNIVRMITDIRVAFKNPLMVFSVYMAALVFLDDFATEHGSQSESNLEFLLKIMATLGTTNPITRSLAIQLAMDMEKSGFDSSVMERVRELTLTPAMVPLLAKTIADSSNMLFCSLKTYNTETTSTTMPFTDQLFAGSAPEPTADNTSTFAVPVPIPGCDGLGMETCAQGTLQAFPENMFE